MRGESPVEQHPFDGDRLVRAIGATFRRRGTPLPRALPPALTEEFTGDPTRQELWQAFLERSGLDRSLKLSDVSETLAGFLDPPTRALVGGKSFGRSWPAGGSWHRG
jgi:hypothetical protein